ncbi:MAG: DNA-directed RNA polymerase subunit omega [Clostridiaceae bacterium]
MNNSMIDPSIINLLNKVGDRYSLVTITARRARQIIEGSKPLIDIDSTKPVTIAINEIYQDLIKYKED